MSETYTVSLSITLEADSPKEAAREFFETISADWDPIVVVRNDDDKELRSFTKDETEDEG